MYLEELGMGRCGLDSSDSEQGIVIRFLNRMIDINLYPEARDRLQSSPN
jgi:hypothetical protein